MCDSAQEAEAKFQQLVRELEGATLFTKIVVDSQVAGDEHTGDMQLTILDSYNHGVCITLYSDGTYTAQPAGGQHDDT